MKKYIQFIIIGALLIIIIVLVSMLTIEPKEKSVQEKLKSYMREAVEEDYSTKNISKDEDYMKTNFMKGCLSEVEGFKGGEDYCACTYNNLLDTIGYRGLVDMSLEMAEEDAISDKTFDVMSNAAADCLDEFE